MLVAPTAAKAVQGRTTGRNQSRYCVAVVLYCICMSFWLVATSDIAKRKFAGNWCNKHSRCAREFTTLWLADADARMAIRIVSLGYDSGPYSWLGPILTRLVSSIIGHRSSVSAAPAWPFPSPSAKLRELPSCARESQLRMARHARHKAVRFVMSAGVNPQATSNKKQADTRVSIFAAGSRKATPEVHCRSVHASRHA